MAVLEHFDNVQDIRFKASLLRVIIKNGLPNEKHPLPRAFELSAIIAAVKNHNLLSEVSIQQTEKTIIQKWASSVDAWVQHLLLLISCKMPDKCWAGICFLGLTCQECSSDRFLASYSDWFQKLLPHIQSPPDQTFVKVACCATLSDLFTRLANFPAAKKDGVANANKIVQPVLSYLAEDESEALQQSSVDLLCALIKFFPASIRRYYDSVECVIVSKMLSGRCKNGMLKKVIQCLAILPNTRGDGGCWSLMMKRILLSINNQLMDTFHGLEEETKGIAFARLMVPPGEEFPPLGQLPKQQMSAQLRQCHFLAVPCVCALIECCSMMLSNDYPVKVAVPVRPLLSLIERVLLIDGSSPPDKVVFMTSPQFEYICLGLPALHMCSLDLLLSLIKILRSQILHHATGIVRSISRYMKTCNFPSIKVKAYSILRILLITVGSGLSVHVAEEIIANALGDLQFRSAASGKTEVHLSDTACEAMPQPHKKRKHDSILLDGNEEQRSFSHAQDVSVQIASLEALEALLTVDGSIKSKYWRSDVDRCLIELAAEICDGGLPEDVTQGSHCGDFQLAVFQALLASLLSLSSVGPPFLSRGLEFFRIGRRKVGSKVAEFCSHALLALEVLIHPRLLSLDSLEDIPNNPGACKEAYKHVPSGDKQPIPFPRTQYGQNGGVPMNLLVKSDSDLNGEDAALPEKQLEEANELLDKNVKESCIGFGPGNTDGSMSVLANGREVVDDGGAVLQEKKLMQANELHNKNVKVSCESLAFEKTEYSQQMDFLQVAERIRRDGSLAIVSTKERGPLRHNFDDRDQVKSGEPFASKDGLPISYKRNTLLYDDSGGSSAESLPEIVDVDPDSSDIDA